MGYYDILHDTNSCYLGLLSDYFDSNIYSNWRSLLEITNKDSWESNQDNFESFDDYISFCILDWAFYIQDPLMDCQQVDLALQMLKSDPKLFKYCKHQVLYDGIIPILKNHVSVKKQDFLKEAIDLAENSKLTSQLPSQE